MEKPRGLCIATRCKTADELVEKLAPSCDDGWLFVNTSVVRPVGSEAPLGIMLADKTVVLRGWCVVFDAWSTSDNPFGRPGMRLGLHRLTPSSMDVFEKMLASRRAAIEQGREVEPGTEALAVVETRTPTMIGIPTIPANVPPPLTITIPPLGSNPTDEVAAPVVVAPVVVEPKPKPIAATAFASKPIPPPIPPFAKFSKPTVPKTIAPSSANAVAPSLDAGNTRMSTAEPAVVSPAAPAVIAAGNPQMVAASFVEAAATPAVESAAVRPTNAEQLEPLRTSNDAATEAPVTNVESMSAVESAAVRSTNTEQMERLRTSNDAGSTVEPTVTNVVEPTPAVESGVVRSTNTGQRERLRTSNDATTEVTNVVEPTPAAESIAVRSTNKRERTRTSNDTKMEAPVTNDVARTSADVAVTNPNPSPVESAGDERARAATESDAEPPGASPRAHERARTSLGSPRIFRPPARVAARGSRPHRKPPTEVTATATKEAPASATPVRVAAPATTQEAPAPATTTKEAPASATHVRVAASATTMKEVPASGTPHVAPSTKKEVPASATPVHVVTESDQRVRIARASVPTETRTPGAALVLPANPLMNLSDASLEGFVDCRLYEELSPSVERVAEPIVPDSVKKRTGSSTLPPRPFVSTSTDVRALVASAPAVRAQGADGLMVAQTRTRAAVAPIAMMRPIVKEPAPVARGSAPEIATATVTAPLVASGSSRHAPAVRVPASWHELVMIAATTGLVAFTISFTLAHWLR